MFGTSDYSDIHVLDTGAFLSVRCPAYDSLTRPLLIFGIRCCVVHAQTDTYTWQARAPRVHPPARGHHTAVLLQGGRMLVTGGIDSRKNVLTDTWSLNLGSYFCSVLSRCQLTHAPACRILGVDADTDRHTDCTSFARCCCGSQMVALPVWR